MKLYSVSASKPHDLTSDLSEAEDLSEFAEKARHYREDDRVIHAAFETEQDAWDMRDIFRDFGATADIFEAEAFEDEPVRYDWRSDKGAYIVEGRRL